ncbi:MAG TPA: D-Ala-D-Ala carboxypeptidase family metallohydrolase [Luteibaculaceae bacterium]|nr:D-Ala-D-Ala carboxypeptidase family metallohydrolase [Luteibaculaceae bacterium]
MQLSKHLSLTEAIKSSTAIRHKINNNPSPEIIERMKLVAENIFEPVREHFKTPIGVSSMYRSKDLNKAVKGSKTSQHMTGEAIDIDADIFGNITNKMIFEFVRDNLDFDQLIWEYGDKHNPAWVHVSYKKQGNRKQILYVR